LCDKGVEREKGVEEIERGIERYRREEGSRERSLGFLDENRAGDCGEGVK
jgi:hypothetical protein